MTKTPLTQVKVGQHIQYPHSNRVYLVNAIVGTALYLLDEHGEEHETKTQYATTEGIKTQSVFIVS